MKTQDWREQGTGERCSSCQYKDLCNRRAFILEILKLFITPRMVIVLGVTIITIIQLIAGGQ